MTTTHVDAEVLSKGEADQVRPNREVRRNKRFGKARALFGQLRTSVSSEDTAKIIGVILGILIAVAIMAVSWWLAIMFFIWLFNVAPVLFWILIAFFGLQMLAGIVMAATK